MEIVSRRRPMGSRLGNSSQTPNTISGNDQSIYATQMGEFNQLFALMMYLPCWVLNKDFNHGALLR